MSTRKDPSLSQPRRRIPEDDTSAPSKVLTGLHGSIGAP
jgi:hypothetical protein